ncbi:3-hydroxyacyl-ACP dehydratase FabZ [Thermoflavimicrobium daqui]|jgi:3-hydroxyacyl-[acyl-carrier-protein] dehydratase|uniref:3-hydroxyacyl-[acyl-carrier-protein] dehydratase FabZ n=1 Tax=Thermoflavimicrobium daqui TaxID=2137476 RepID=A0A364K5C5_9BACL|nr:3-hydroxyacyl-ACP dehydratase FabZ [Thermoflavimicrobium daqui]RAL24580.1 3-hydroxyacyl-[acyl-carrier-protein] dehydratase FabZ [Thermoflavimicrobium daqui]
MVFDIREIQQTIPHRYPFLLVDKIIEHVPGEKAVGVKNVTINEPFFQGHFPEYPVMPGVLIVEALAQVGAMCVLSMDEYKGKLGFLTGVDKFRFREQVKPGDVLTLEVELIKLRRNIGKGKGTAKVGDKVVADGEVMFAIVDAN